ncbi:unnamed protein product, partial [Polarella glacialis]
SGTALETSVDGLAERLLGWATVGGAGAASQEASTSGAAEQDVPPSAEGNPFAEDFPDSPWEGTKVREVEVQEESALEKAAEASAEAEAEEQAPSKESSSVVSSQESQPLSAAPVDPEPGGKGSLPQAEVEPQKDAVTSGAEESATVAPQAESTAPPSGGDGEAPEEPPSSPDDEPSEDTAGQRASGTPNGSDKEGEAPAPVSSEARDEAAAAAEAAAASAAAAATAHMQRAAAAAAATAVTAAEAEARYE